MKLEKINYDGRFGEPQVFLGGFRYDQNAGMLCSGYVAVPPGHPLWGVRTEDTSKVGRLISDAIDYGEHIDDFMRKIDDNIAMSKKGAEILEKPDSNWWVFGAGVLDAEHLFLDLDDNYNMLRQMEDYRAILAGGEKAFLERNSTCNSRELLKLVNEDISHYLNECFIEDKYDAWAEGNSVVVGRWNDVATKREVVLTASSYEDFLSKWIAEVNWKMGQLHGGTYEAEVERGSLMVEIKPKEQYIAITGVEDGEDWEVLLDGEDYLRAEYDLRKLISESDGVNVGFDKIALEYGSVLADYSYDGDMREGFAGAYVATSKMIRDKKLHYAINQLPYMVYIDKMPQGADATMADVKFDVMADFPFSAEMRHVAIAALQQYSREHLILNSKDSACIAIGLAKHDVEYGYDGEVSGVMVGPKHRLNEEGRALVPYSNDIEFQLLRQMEKSWLKYARQELEQNSAVVFDNGDVYHMEVHDRGDGTGIEVSLMGAVGDGIAEYCCILARPDKSVEWHMNELKSQMVSLNPELGLKSDHGEDRGSGLLR